MACMMMVVVEPTKTGRWKWHGVTIYTEHSRHEANLKLPQLAQEQRPGPSMYGTAASQPEHPSQPEPAKMKIVGVQWTNMRACGVHQLYAIMLNQMDHTEAVRKLAVEQYLLGELSGRELEEFEEHFFGCPECVEALEIGTGFMKDARGVFSGYHKLESE